MGRGIEKLSALKIKRLSTPGYFGDGGGLYLQVGRTGSKSWIFRYARTGREREMGLGSLNAVGLTEARDKARQLRLCLASGGDPMEMRSEELARRHAHQARNLDFDACAAQYISAHEAGWRNQKHRQQWENTLRVHASPHIGQVHVRRIDAAMIMKVLEPIWRTKTETASRLRERIERVLAWATVRGYREGENPARWKDHLDQMLPEPSKVKKVKHYSALPISQLAEFLSVLREQKGVAARAMEFTILTASRTGEVLGAVWSEIDLGEAAWNIPGERMKANRPHRVPLSPQALKVVEAQRGADPCYVFPGSTGKKPLSNMAMLTLLKRMKRQDITVHGFRSTFRDWAAEQTDFPREVVELALAHAVGSAVENAYRRTDLFDRRRQLMEAWAMFCGASPTVAGAQAS
jgi:integrase